MPTRQPPMTAADSEALTRVGPGTLVGNLMREYWIPAALSSEAASFVLLFIIGFREFTPPMILQSPDNVVLSVMMWKAFQGAKTMEAAAIGTVIVVLVIPGIFAVRNLVPARDDAD